MLLRTRSFRRIARAVKIMLLMLISTACLVRSRDISKRQIGTLKLSVNTALSPLQEKEDKISKAILDLALDVSAIQWEKGLSGNVVQSPLSIAGLLSMLLLASRGESYAEIKRALNYPNDVSDSVIHETFKNILDSLEQTAVGVDVSMSSRLFLQEKLSILGQFTKIIEDSYNSKVVGMDFAHSPREAMNSINQWVERSTFGEITNLITSPFSPSTKFVAANVVYFEGEWKNQFSSKITKNGLFNTGSRNVTVPMMTHIMTVPFYKGTQIGFDIVALPYKGGKYSMYILTPDGKPGIASVRRLEYTINSSNLDPLLSQMRKTKVSVTIPRMKLHQKLYLKDDLKFLGVKNIFDPRKADFGRLTTETGIFVDDIVHEAVLEITETGTVGAAATAATIDRIGGNEIFQLNKPSLLFIRDNDSGLVLFWSRVMEPEPIFN